MVRSDSIRRQCLVSCVVVVVVLVTLMITGCANYRPVVDSKSIASPEMYERDLSDCRRYADTVSPAGGAVLGAVLGAAFGAAVGYVAGDADIGMSAGLGALGGAAGGIGGSVTDQKDIIRTCMRDRGYSVLN